MSPLTSDNQKEKRRVGERGQAGRGEGKGGGGRGRGNLGKVTK